MDACYRGVAEILLFGSQNTPEEVQVILEDAENPIRARTLNKLYESLQANGRIDFGDIAKSAGDITNFSGYSYMMDTLKSLRELPAADVKTENAFLSQVAVVERAITNIRSCAPLYKLAFIKGNRIAILEYNAFTAACVEATTALLYNFVEYLYPKTGASSIVASVSAAKNSKGMFYLDQLRTFGLTVDDGRYRKYLASLVNNGTENFLGAAATGAAVGAGASAGLLVGSVAIAALVAVSVVPVTRRLIYSFQNARRSIADCLQLQAYYLELNQTILEANQTMDAGKKEKVLKRQNELRLKFLRLADKIRVESMRNEELTRRNLEKDNKVMSIDNIRDEISTDDIVLV